MSATISSEVAGLERLVQEGGNGTESGCELGT